MPLKFKAWDTKQVEQASRFDYYRSGLCESFAHLTPHKPEDCAIFSAKVEHWFSGNSEFTFIETSTHLVSRSREDITRVEDDDFYVNFIQLGEMRLDQFGNRNILRPGDISVIDNAHVFDAQINSVAGHRHLAFRMDREKVSIEAGELSRRLENHQLTPALRQALHYLCRVDQSWPSDHLTNVTAAIESLVRIIAAAEPPSVNLSRAYATSDRVRKLIVEGFTDPEFSLDSVTGRLRMPRRSIQKHLQICGQSFSSMLLETRLEQAQRMLMQSGGGICIADICFRCGFNELSTFYRAFRNRFGAPPGSFRHSLR